MTKPLSEPSTLKAWLVYIEALHPNTIEMGLERLNAVATRLGISPDFPIITVGGTNGKGSTCAMLNEIYTQAGYRTGCYTSPHLIRYNERVKINNQEAIDDDLCEAFQAVEHARGSTALTYFEMGTLAAMWHFCRQKLDVCILEVGMGGRLDAVNSFEPECAIVTAVDIDHQEYLGDTREKIGLEKAGIYRTQKLAICGDENAPQSLLEHVKKIDADLALIGRDFSVEKTDTGWNYQEKGKTIAMPPLALSGDFQLRNAACALRAVMGLNAKLPVSQAHIHQAFKNVRLTGRFQRLQRYPEIIIDVAHNPQAAQSLAHNLNANPNAGRTRAVFAMLADKDIPGVVHALLPHIDDWYIADIDAKRGAKAELLKKVLIKEVDMSNIQAFPNIKTALSSACLEATKNDRIVVFGSFYTVAEAISSLSN